MKKIQIYLMPIIVVALLLLVAGCSTDGNGVASVDTDGIEENVSDGIEDLLGGFSEDGDSSEVDDEAEDEGENVPRVLIVDDELDRKDSSKDTNEDSPIAPLKLENRGEVDLDDADYGVDYDTTVQLKIRGGVKPYILSVEGLPLGSMVFDGDTGKITGQASELGDFTLQVRVTDAEGVVSDPLEKRLSVKDKYTIELRYNDADISEAENIPFDDKILSAHVVGGHAQSYTWTVKIDGGDEAEYTSVDGTKAIPLRLPDVDAAEQKEFAVEIYVVDEFGNEASLNPTVTRDLNPCAIPLKIKIDKNKAGEDSLGGVTISASGGMGEYEFEISLDKTVTLYDLDGKKLDEGAELSENGDSPEKVNVSKRELEGGGYDIDVLSFPKMSGVAGYSVAGSVKVMDKQCNINSTDIFSIEKKETTDTLADLKMICDFEDIKHSDTGDSYLEFDIYTSDEAVAQVHYDLTTCNEREKNCERKDGEKFEEIEGSNVNLASIDLNEITEIRYKVHKKRKKTSFWRVVGAIATAGISASVSTNTADKKKLDVDVQWCRFYTDNWFAIWDDQKHGNVLNDNEVGGRHRASARALRTKFIIDRMEGYEESGNIWFMNDMLESVASDSEDGFDYMTIRDNDCSDGDHDWCD